MEKSLSLIFQSYGDFMTKEYFPWNGGDGDRVRAKVEALNFIRELKVDECYLVDAQLIEHVSEFVVEWKVR